MVCVSQHRGDAGNNWRDHSVSSYPQCSTFTKVLHFVSSRAYGGVSDFAPKELFKILVWISRLHADLAPAIRKTTDTSVEFRIRASSIVPALAEVLFRVHGIWDAESMSVGMGGIELRDD